MQELLKIPSCSKGILGTTEILPRKAQIVYMSPWDSQELPWDLRDFKRLPGTPKDFQKLLGTTSDSKGLLGPPRIYQRLKKTPRNSNGTPRDSKVLPVAPKKSLEPQKSSQEKSLGLLGTPWDSQGHPKVSLGLPRSHRASHGLLGTPRNFQRLKKTPRNSNEIPRVTKGLKRLQRNPWNSTQNASDQRSSMRS